MRIPRNAPGISDLICILDDRLDSKALLLYQIDSYSEGQVYGSTGIPWSAIDFAQGPWLPLAKREWVSPQDFPCVHHPLAAEYTHIPSEPVSRGNVPQAELQLREILDQHKYCREDNKGLLWLLNPLQSYKMRREEKMLEAVARCLIQADPLYLAAFQRIRTIISREDPRYAFLRELEDLLPASCMKLM
jgi:hypothetical protein